MRGSGKYRVFSEHTGVVSFHRMLFVDIVNVQYIILVPLHVSFTCFCSVFLFDFTDFSSVMATEVKNSYI